MVMTDNTGRRALSVGEDPPSGVDCPTSAAGRATQMRHCLTTTSGALPLRLRIPPAIMHLRFADGLIPQTGLSPGIPAEGSEPGVSISARRL